MRVKVYLGNQWFTRHAFALLGFNGTVVVWETRIFIAFVPSGVYAIVQHEQNFGMKCQTPPQRHDRA